MNVPMKVMTIPGLDNGRRLEQMRRESMARAKEARSRQARSRMAAALLAGIRSKKKAE